MPPGWLSLMDIEQQIDVSYPLSYSCLAEPSTKVRGIHLYAPFADALYPFKSRGLGGEAGLVAKRVGISPGKVP